MTRLHLVANPQEERELQATAVALVRIIRALIRETDTTPGQVADALTYEGPDGLRFALKTMVGVQVGDHVWQRVCDLLRVGQSDA